MPRSGGQRAAARPADLGSASRPRAVRRENGESQASGAGAESGRLMIDLEFLRGLIEAIDNSGIDSLEINRAGTKIRISKTPPPLTLAASPASALPPLPSPLPAALPPAAIHAPTVSTPASTAPAPATPPATNLVEVKSPMVGTFYRAPAPEAPPYVEVGSVVKKGQTLCILEAMKLMNELECELDGVVREILVENSDPVEYGQVLFRVEPS
jgi:acetyl-CoA carboxylase biotin carboxyl carrier protein